MKKQSSVSLTGHVEHAKPANLDSDSPFETHPLMEWLFRNGKNILFGILGSFLFLFIFSLWLMRSHDDAAKGYFEAKSAFQSFERATGPEKQATTLAQLNRVLAANPQLHALYDGNIAQVLINRNEAALAKPFADATLKRILPDNLEIHRAFSNISLSIVNNELQSALKDSLALQQKLTAIQGQQSWAGGDLLPVYNQLRIAFLYSALELKSEELKAWNAWKQQASADSYKTISALFADGKLTLDDYIDSRVHALENSGQQKLQ